MIYGICKKSIENLNAYDGDDISDYLLGIWSSYHGYLGKPIAEISNNLTIKMPSNMLAHSKRHLCGTVARQADWYILQVKPNIIGFTHRENFMASIKIS